MAGRRFPGTPAPVEGRHLKANKIVIALWGVALSGYFQDTEPKFRFEVREGIILVGYGVAIFFL